MKIFLDDERTTPEGWTRAYSVEDAQLFILTTRLPQCNYTIEALSLDHDLGENVPSGYDLLNWLEELVYNDPSFPVPEITIHSANPTGRANMMRALESIKRIKQAQAQE